MVIQKFRIFSHDFKEGEEIPKNCGYDHGNKRPTIEVEGGFPNYETLAFIMDDPDAKAAVGKVWVHFLWYHTASGDRVYGKNSWGKIDYGGPAPPDKRHTYVFKLYALDCKLDLPNESTKADVEKAMEGHIIEQVTLTGTYAP